MRGRQPKFVVSVLLTWACTNNSVRPPATPDGGPSIVVPTLPVRPELPGPLPELAPRFIQAENALPGDSRWDRFDHKSTAGQLEGYADRVSAKAGESVAVKVSADGHHTATWRLYRMGWYSGALARSVASGGPYAVGTQTACPMDRDTGLIQCGWTTSFSIPIEDSYLSGMYVIKLVRDDGYGSFVPLIVRDDRPAKFLFQSSVLTSQAYNPWHGESLYNDRSGTLPWRHAVEVSFDRPYAEGNGAGQQLRYEAYLLRFLEQYGYDVTYTTNLDVVAGGLSRIQQHAAFLSVGHDEYWPKAERDLLESARDAGVSLLFFGANMAYWQVRLEDDRGAGPRRVVGWKEAFASDPIQGPETTARFRDPPINRPENALLGVMFGTWMNIRSPLVVANSHHWLFDGTGMDDGDAIPWLVGYESDSRFSNGAEPANLDVAARSPTISVDGYSGVASAVSYRAPSGALVFSSGSVEWVWGLGYPGVADPRVARMTANVLHEATGVRIPPLVPMNLPPPVLVEDATAARVETLLRNRGAVAGVAALPDGSLAVTESDRNRVLRIGPPPNRDVSVLAGTGEAGSGDWTSPVAGDQAQFRSPTGIVADAQGNLYVADTGNHCIRFIRNDAAHTVSTPTGYCGASGDAEGSGRHALFSAPMGLTFDPLDGDLLIADSWNHRVRRIDSVTGESSTVLGGSEGAADGPVAAAQLSYPTGLAFDATGCLYVLSSGDFRVVQVTPGPLGIATTIAGSNVGTDDGSGSTAGIAPELGVVWTAAGLLVADASAGRIRRIVPGAGASGTSVTTFAGRGMGGCHDGSTSASTFLFPLGLAIDAQGVLYIADSGNGALRAVWP